MTTPRSISVSRNPKTASDIRFIVLAGVWCGLFVASIVVNLC